MQLPNEMGYYTAAFRPEQRGIYKGYKLLPQGHTLLKHNPDF